MGKKLQKVLGLERYQSEHRQKTHKAREER